MPQTTENQSAAASPLMELSKEELVGKVEALTLAYHIFAAGLVMAKGQLFNDFSLNENTIKDLVTIMRRAGGLADRADLQTIAEHPLTDHGRALTEMLRIGKERQEA